MKSIAAAVLLSLSSISLISQNLIFKSSFEDGVYLEAPYFDDPNSGTWWQDLKGADNSNFSWPVNLWGGKGTFQVLVDAQLPHADYIENTLETVLTNNGLPTRVLHQQIKQKAEGFTQDPYIVETNYEGGDLYVRFSIKYNANLPEVLGPDGWLTFFEWKTSGDYRIAAYIYADKKKNLYWYVHGDNVANGGLPYEEFWFKEDHNLEVPLNKWFTMEFFSHRSTGNDGRFWWAVDGHVIADYKGATKKIKDIDRIMLFTTYTGADALEQWIDAIEIWDDFPCGNGTPCFSAPTAAIDEFTAQRELTKFKSIPNPTTNTVNLTYYLPKKAFVEIDLYTVQGKKIKTILAKNQYSGKQKVSVSLENIAAGIYYCKLHSKEMTSQTLKLIIKN